MIRGRRRLKAYGADDFIHSVKKEALKVSQTSAILAPQSGVIDNLWDSRWFSTLSRAQPDVDRADLSEVGWMPKCSEASGSPSRGGQNIEPLWSFLPGKACHQSSGFYISDLLRIAKPHLVFAIRLDNPDQLLKPIFAHCAYWRPQNGVKND